MIAAAQDPVTWTNYTADPAPMVKGDTLYLYTSHDEDDADGFKMYDWLLYTTTDMVNWTDCGPVAGLKNFKWCRRDNGAWAIQVVERNGKYYMYCPLHGNGIGVLVADSPYGPFTDPLGHPLVWQKEHWNDIDPTVMIDDDGQAYMYWGNPHLYSVKLNDDMISYSGEITQHPHINDYQEGPWIWKHKGNYYLAFASTCCPEGIGYAMADNPMGPWTYKGHIMDHTPRTRGNHPGIADFKGKHYVFGHSYDILRLQTPDHHERRSVNVAEMTYNPDGTINEVPYWKDTELKQVGTLNPYRRVEAETMARGYGLKTVAVKTGGRAVTSIDPGEFIKVAGVNFGKKAPKAVKMLVASAGEGRTVKVHIDSPEGEVIATLPVEPTGSVDAFTWQTSPVTVKKLTGVHDLFFTFGGGNMLFDAWEFEK